MLEWQLATPLQYLLGNSLSPVSIACTPSTSPHISSRAALDGRGEMSLGKALNAFSKKTKCIPYRGKLKPVEDSPKER